MARTTKRRKVLRTGLLTKLLILILLAALGCQLYALQEQVEQARTEREADIDEGCTPEKMQEIARRELGWVLPDEYVFDVSN